MINEIQLKKARWRLFFCWLIGSMIIFIIVVIQSLLGTYEITTENGLNNQVEKVWSWIIPLLFPTLSLMGGVISSDSNFKNRSSSISTKLYKVVLALCIFYLFLIFALIFLWPLLKIENPFDVFSISNFFIVPLQGIVIVLITKLFISKE